MDFLIGEDVAVRMQDVVVSILGQRRSRQDKTDFLF